MNYILLKDLPDAKAGDTLEKYDENTYKIGRHYWTSDIIENNPDWFAPMHSYSELRIKALEEQLAKISADYAKLEADYAKLEAQNMELATGSIKLVSKCAEMETQIASVTDDLKAAVAINELHKDNKWKDEDMKNIAMQYLACNKRFGSVDLFFDAWLSTRI